MPIIGKAEKLIEPMATNPRNAASKKISAPAHRPSQPIRIKPRCGLGVLGSPQRHSRHNPRVTAPIHQLSQRFYFEAAHTLRRAAETGEVESSRRVHGHTYQAEVTLQGQPDSRGMVMDLGLLRTRIAALRERLDHRFLDEVEGLGPATLENLCSFIARQLAADVPQLVQVSVWREASGDRCTLLL